MNPTFYSPQERVIGQTEFIGAALMLTFIFCVKMGYFAHVIYSTRMAFHRSVKIRNEVDAQSRAFCEKMRPLWLVQYYELRRIGLEAERRQIELRKTETRTETSAYIVQLTHRF